LAAADLTDSSHTTEVLLCQAWIAAGSADVLDMQTFAGYAGQGQTRSQYLASPLACAAINENGFHNYSSGIPINTSPITEQPGNDPAKALCRTGPDIDFRRPNYNNVSLFLPAGEKD